MVRLKILVVGTTCNLGGIEVFVRNLIKYSNKNKFDYYLLMEKNIINPFQDELTKMGCKIITMNSDKKNILKYIHEYMSILKKYKFDIIHYNVMEYSSIDKILISNIVSKSKIIIHSHNGGLKKESRFRKIRQFFRKALIKNVNYYMVACGEKAGKYMFKNKTFEIFYNGIEIEKYLFDYNNRNEIRKELGVKESEFLIGLIAKLDKQKNQIFLLEVFSEYLKLNSESKLLLVGCGPLKDEIEVKINELSLQGKVIMTGRRNDVYKIYSALDLLVMPSLYEGLSITLIEAQINGLKCYTSTNVDKNSNITGNVDFLSLNNSIEWANEIYSNPNERQKNILNKIPDKYDVKKSVKDINNYYCSICQ